MATLIHIKPCQRHLCIQKRTALTRTLRFHPFVPATPLYTIDVTHAPAYTYTRLFSNVIYSHTSVQLLCVRVVNNNTLTHTQWPAVWCGSSRELRAALAWLTTTHRPQSRDRPTNCNQHKGSAAAVAANTHRWFRVSAILRSHSES